MDEKMCSVDPIPAARHYYSFRCIDDSYNAYGQRTMISNSKRYKGCYFTSLHQSKSIRISTKRLPRQLWILRCPSWYYNLHLRPRCNSNVDELGIVLRQRLAITAIQRIGHTCPIEHGKNRIPEAVISRRSCGVNSEWELIRRILPRTRYRQEEAISNITRYTVTTERYAVEEVAGVTQDRIYACTNVTLGSDQNHRREVLGIRQDGCVPVG